MNSSVQTQQSTGYYRPKRNLRIQSQERPQESTLEYANFIRAQVRELQYVCDELRAQIPGKAEVQSAERKMLRAKRLVASTLLSWAVSLLILLYAWALFPSPSQSYRIVPAEILCILMGVAFWLVVPVYSRFSRRYDLIIQMERQLEGEIAARENLASRVSEGLELVRREAQVTEPQWPDSQPVSEDREAVNWGEISEATIPTHRPVPAPDRAGYHETFSSQD